MPDLDKLRELCAWMRQERILYARCGELELRLDPSPPLAAVAVDPSPAQAPDGDDVTRQALEDLLHSSGADPDVILRLMKRSAA